MKISNRRLTTIFEVTGSSLAIALYPPVRGRIIRMVSMGSMTGHRLIEDQPL
jgi:hypothetical protein